MSTSAAPPSADEIRDRAYWLWQRDGCPEGRSVEYWLRAEADLAAPGGGAGSDGGGLGPGPGLAEAPPPPMDEPPAAAPARRPARRAAKAEGPSGAGPGAAPEAAPWAAGEAADRAGYVEQKRTRRKAEG